MLTDYHRKAENSIHPIKTSLCRGVNKTCFKLICEVDKILLNWLFSTKHLKICLQKAGKNAKFLTNQIAKFLTNQILFELAQIMEIILSYENIKK